MPITPEKTADYAKLKGTAYRLGCLDVATDFGPVHAHDAVGVSTLTIVRGKIPTTIGILAYGEDARGLVHQLTADGARELAASLLRLADAIDPETVQ